MDLEKTGLIMNNSKSTRLKLGHGMHWVAILVILLVASVANAQHPKKRPPFNPAKFQADLEQFITREACLTPVEAAKFFPLHREMMKRQRVLFDQMRRMRQIDPTDNNACAEAIRKQDELDIQIKQLQQEYHSRFMFAIPASKVLGVIKAEEKFHRQMFRKMK